MLRLSWRGPVSLLAVLLAAAGLPLGAAAPAPHLGLRTVAVAAGTAVRAPAAFTLLGVDLPRGATAPAVRVSADGRRWSPWLPLEAVRGEHGPSEPVWTGAARHLQLRGLPPGRVRTHLLDVPPVPTDVRVAAAQDAGRPAIVSRRQWGADERLRRGGPRYAARIRAAIVHHTAGGNTYSRTEAPAVVRAIYAYHTRVLGWDDIGYNLLVDRFGRAYEGRAGGVDRPVIGAHAGGFNTETTGVSVLGTYQDTLPPREALAGLADVLAWKAATHGLDPRGSTVLRSGGSTRYPAGTAVRLAVISGHRDVSRTACPGAALYGYLPRLRDETARRMRTAPAPLPDLPLLEVS